MPDRWYEHVTVYSVDVRALADSDGDGCGDLRGLIGKLDYLHGLGAGALWLQPIYRTPFRDDGYDVTDYYSLDPRVGTLHDFIRLVEAAHDRDMRIIMDLVVDHTSIDHPWFRAARRDADSPYREYYVWADTPHDVGAEPIFPGHQDGVWSWDDEAGRYYLHRFYGHEPDLNIASEAVQEEIRDVLRFWAGLGASGFRLDAAPYIVRKAGWSGGDGHRFLRDLHDLARSLRPDAVLLAETDIAPEEYATFFGGGEELDLLFNFYSNEYLFLALARQDATPLAGALERLPPPPPAARYVNWLRNHDELDLGRLSDAERKEVYEAFAPSEGMRLYDRGIRRRLAPMLEGDRARIGNAFGILFGLPGVPVVLYGEELGMGEDLSQPERESVRTAMQWDASPNGGFSSAPPEQLIRPVIDDGRFGYPSLNLADSRLDPGSLPSTVERLIRARRESPEIAKGSWTTIATGTRRAFAVRYDWAGRTLVVLANISPDPVRVHLDVDVAFLEPLVSDAPYGDCDPEDLELGPYGFRWLRGPVRSDAP